MFCFKRREKLWNLAGRMYHHYDIVLSSIRLSLLITNSPVTAHVQKKKNLLQSVPSHVGGFRPLTMTLQSYRYHPGQTFGGELRGKKTYSQIYHRCFLLHTSALALSTSSLTSSALIPNTRVNSASVYASTPSRTFNTLYRPISFSIASLGHAPIGSRSLVSETSVKPAARMRGTKVEAWCVKGRAADSLAVEMRETI